METIRLPTSLVCPSCNSEVQREVASPRQCPRCRAPWRRYILYARVSTPKQAEQTSLDYQIEREYPYVQEISGVVVAEIRDDQSGKRMDRDGLMAAREMLAADEADGLVTWKIHRLHRNFINGLLLREEIHRIGKELHYADRRRRAGINTKEQLPENVEYMFAEMELDEIIERTTVGRRLKAKGKDGKPGRYLGQGRAPYGYKNVGRNHESAMVIDEWEKLDDPILYQRIMRGEVWHEVLTAVRAGQATAVVVRWIFAWYTHGDAENRPLSATNIARRLTDLGIPTPTDLLEGAERYKRSTGWGQWHRNSVRVILRQQGYTGTFYHFRYKHVGDGKLIQRPSEEWIGVDVPVIVDHVIWEEAAQKLATAREMSSRNEKHDYLVSRRITCNHCGYKMAGATYKVKAKPPRHRNSYVFSYYRCVGHTRGNTEYCAAMKNVRADYIDGFVWQWVCEELTNLEKLERKLKELQMSQRRTVSTKDEQMRVLVEQRTDFERQLDQLADMLLSGRILQTTYDDKFGTLRKQHTRIQLAIEELAQKAETPLTDERIANLVAFAEDFQQRIQTALEHFDVRRAIIEDLDVRVVCERREDKQVWLGLTSVLRPEQGFHVVPTSSR